jgi:catechol 2,3-dioxygenase-like lactoylglutathione lyase family enzyme
MNIHHTALVCSSTANAERFYNVVLGLKKIKSSKLEADLAEKIFGAAIACQYVLYGGENFAVEIFVVSEGDRNDRKFEHICLEVEDREEFVARCRSNEVEINRIAKGNAELVFIKDFDGNLFEIKEI